MYQDVSRCIKMCQDVSSKIDFINGNYNIIRLVRDIKTMRYCDSIILQCWNIEILRYWAVKILGYWDIKYWDN